MICKLGAEPSWEEILRVHAARYPDMQPSDAVKLCYQASFGPGHLIRDTASAQAWIEQERTDAPDPAVRFEEIGGGYVRRYLDRGMSEEDAALLMRELAVSAETEGSTDALETRLGQLCSRTEAGEMPFSADSLRAYLEDYRKAGMPAVHHSEAYRAAYQPAYRVIRREFGLLDAMITRVQKQVRQSGEAILVLDGYAASGKTTLAALLGKLFGARVIHMDDFFLPPEKRTAERLNEPGGNVDYERFAEEVVRHLADERLTYGVFDCGEMRVTHTVTLPKTPVTIVEGAYALHPAFGAYADVTAFVRCSPEEQERRIFLRNGEAMLEKFRSRWIPMERRYAEAFSVADQADYELIT